MTTSKLSRLLFALIAALVLAAGIAACGDDDDDGDDGGETTSPRPIESNPDNEGVELTVGSKNFNEQFILGEIYAQALEAAGYDVKTDLNLGSEQIALKALEDGEISGYPEYTSTALTSFFDVPPEEVPSDAQAGRRRDAGSSSRSRAWSPSRRPRSTAPTRSGCSRSTAEELGVATISDLEGVSPRT